MARLEELLRRMTGHSCQLRVEAVSGGPSGETPAAADDPVNPPSRYRRQRAEAVQEPLLKRAIDVLGAQIVHVDDGFGGAPTPAAERADDGDGEEA